MRQRRGDTVVCVNHYLGLNNLGRPLLKGDKLSSPLPFKTLSCGCDTCTTPVISIYTSSSVGNISPQEACGGQKGM